MTYFISGHRNLTQEEFTKWYSPLIFLAYNNDAKFVVADCEGCDRMAQDYLAALNVTDVTVCHMGNRPRYVASANFKLRGYYMSDVDRDSTMTRNSDCDIAFIRKGREDSGTAQNILRRWTKN